MSAPDVATTGRARAAALRNEAVHNALYLIYEGRRQAATDLLITSVWDQHRLIEADKESAR